MADAVVIDLAEVRAAARALRTSADAVGGAARTVSDCGFGPSVAGRDCGAHGAAIREGYLRLARALGMWASASAGSAQVLDSTAAGYSRQESTNTSRFGLR
ncbi:N-acyl-D-amino-acid deacylase [Rhodococcus sp. ABRD24]|uniref:type VII secretion target n=1 Tax=Rhodococcus sp. ABRD24 TaxID=2507582 RepID=UPI00103CC890|nr:N-acyl-D-amino-acid deacylase [Rhodococcus sp. ABRD24]QBJ95505.1 N-acyl-D-amino-acid deacylase [Rhodococcus sp. ABRD24]